jgi:regulator of sirC expression with transglutaminase-like and TPR domain
MQETSEIRALITLLDDEDAIVFENVSKKLLSYGKAVTPNLMNAIDNTTDRILQEKLEAIIHSLNFCDLKIKLKEWQQNPKATFFEGMLLLCNFKYNEIDEQAIAKKIKSIYQSVWLELNSYLSPVEQINILSSIIHNMYRLKQNDTGKNYLNDFFINNLLKNGVGNAYSLGAVYLQLTELFDIPLYPLDIPNQFLLGYFDTIVDFRNPHEINNSRVLFYVDPSNGMIYTDADIHQYLTTINIEQEIKIDKKINAQQAIKKCLMQLHQCLFQLKSTEVFLRELEDLMEMMEE